ncbi:hypothetical protein [Pollutimonas nitritireducens]|uniref:hypothetical protein n=1 Tax=Pollutimonas nitritireducens TaxID=2045209 RepID=UPI001304229E|nr:hypothetical protein [Pollutimonas nitritireducens]
MLASPIAPLLPQTALLQVSLLAHPLLGLAEACQADIAWTKHPKQALALVDNPQAHL